MNGEPDLVVRAVKARQGEGTDVFAFFLYGSDLTRIADISRIARDDGEVKGFQRKEIRAHVNAIVEFLDSGPVLFPNAMILALSPEVEFKNARGSRPEGMTDVADVGTLSIPVRPEGQRAAWIVDGQQRSLALARAKNNKIAVPVVGFVSPDLETQREQFILVNKAKPLPTRLINELLPEVSALLPRDLAARKLPSELCNALNQRPAVALLQARSSARLTVPRDERCRHGHGGHRGDQAEPEDRRSAPSASTSEAAMGTGDRCRRHASRAGPLLVGGAEHVPGGLGQAGDGEPADALGRHPGDGRADGPDHAAGRLLAVARGRDPGLAGADRAALLLGRRAHGKGLAGAGTRSSQRASTSLASAIT